MNAIATATRRRPYGLGSRASAGVILATRAGLRAPVEGSDVTTSGSCALFSACSIAADQAERDVHMTMGIETIRLASLPHAGHAADSGAVPSGRDISNTPSWSHRYSYMAIALLRLIRKHHPWARPGPRLHWNAKTSLDLRVAGAP